MSFYVILVLVHSWLRWVILGLGVAVLARSFVGWRRGRDFQRMDAGLHAGFAHTLGLQLIIGGVLYFLSPITSQVFSNPGGVMKVSHMRFFAVEHVALMLVAVVVAQITWSRARKIEDGRKRYRRVFVTVLIVLALVAAAIPWPGMAAERPLFRTALGV